MIDWSLFASAGAALAVERIAYVWIFHHPGVFERLAARTPLTREIGAVELLRRLFLCFKAVQLGVFAAWIWVHGRQTPSTAPVAAMAVGAALVAGGQWLNLRVFRLLGANGVFYGNRFGLELPWCRSFPFSVMAHPQYVGACVSVWGLFLGTRFPHADWLALPLLETAYYVAGSLLERDTRQSMRCP